MIKIIKYVLLLLTTFVLVACSAADNQENDAEPDQGHSPPVENNTLEDHSDNTEDPQDEDIENVQLRSFFLPDGTKAHYEGIGNEFAELHLEVHQIGEEYIVIDEDNGGVTIRKIYRITDNQIDVLSENPIDLSEALPEEEELTNLAQQEVYLKRPLEAGTEFGEWRIVETEGTVQTPYQHFDNVLIVESVDDDFTIRRYLVPEYGEVVRESIMVTEEGDDFIVTSSLKSLES